jgi:EPS-associated MarR family transcriptional regulator
MTQEEEQVLSVLDAIALNSRTSQRDLSRTTGLNVAKVNYLLRKMTEKGFVKLRNVSRNPNKLGYLYLLTPRGLTEKSRLTVRFAARTWREYSRTMDILRTSLARLAASGEQAIVLVGANEVADMVIEAGSGTPGIRVVGIVDPAGAGSRRGDVPVLADVRQLAYDRAILCVDQEPGATEMAFLAGIEKDKLWQV